MNSIKSFCLFILKHSDPRSIHSNEMIIVGERESKLAVEHFDEEKEEILNGI